MVGPDRSSAWRPGGLGRKRTGWQPIGPERRTTAKPNPVSFQTHQAEAAERRQGKLLPQQQKLLERDWKSKGVRLPAHSPSVQAAIARAQAEQVDLIKTLPRTAAEKAQEMAEKAALETGDRSDKLIAQLQGLEPGYPEFAARRLARTEIAKSQSLLVEAQAKDAGVTHYVWCTMDDEAVRDSHKKLDGQIFRFDDLSDKDGDGCPAPGQIYNCRCYARPLLPGEDS